MIPIRLNLLSPEKRRFHQGATYVQFTKNMLEALFLALCVAGIILLFGQNILQNQFRDLSSSLVVSESKYLQKNREVDSINNGIQRVQRIQKEFVLWSPMLHDFFNQIPPTIALGSVTFDRSANVLLLTGVASTRADLLLFKNTLTALPWISPFELPLSALVEKEQIHFSLTVPVKP
jgi:Tfp pilus assembly protein PilN